MYVSRISARRTGRDVGGCGLIDGFVRLRVGLRESMLLSEVGSQRENSLWVRNENLKWLSSVSRECQLAASCRSYLPEPDLEHRLHYCSLLHFTHNGLICVGPRCCISFVELQLIVHRYIEVALRPLPIFECRLRRLFLNRPLILSLAIFILR